MDTAVGLVQAYLRVNGYFTVAEYPVLDATGPAGPRTITDLDILAVRLHRAPGASGAADAPLDPALGAGGGADDAFQRGAGRRPDGRRSTVGAEATGSAARAGSVRHNSIRTSFI